MIWAVLVGCGTSPAPVPSPAPDPCTEAWVELGDANRALSALAVGVAAPTETDFRAACALLPEDARPCFSPAWRLAHGPACDEALARVPKDTRKRVDALLDATEAPQ